MVNIENILQVIANIVTIIVGITTIAKNLKNK